MRCIGKYKYLRCIVDSSVASRKYTTARPDIRLMEELDSSIPTMEKILTILRDAEEHNDKTLLFSETNTNSIVDEETSLCRFHTALGAKLLNYQIHRLLNDLDIVGKYNGFENIKPDTCEHIFKHYTSALRESYLRKQNSVPFASLGEGFLLNPVQLNNKIRPQLNDIASQILMGYNDTKLPSKFSSNFPVIKLPNPFRGKVKHPLIFQKGLNAKGKPLNILPFLLDDEHILEDFLNKLRSSILPKLIVNLMKAQEVEGRAAFQLLITKYLGEFELCKGPLEAVNDFNLKDDEELESHLAVLKAIVAHKSNILTRLDSLRIYRSSISKVDFSSLKSSEVMKLLGRSFDRYFSACYRADAKQCDFWVKDLVQFYRHNWSSEDFFEDMFAESINNLRERLTSATLQRLQETWTPMLNYMTEDQRINSRIKS